jgi:hypothetical protein
LEVRGLVWQPSNNLSKRPQHLKERHAWFGPGGIRPRYDRTAHGIEASKVHVTVHRPGQVVALDTTPLPVQVRDGVFGEPVSAHLGRAHQPLAASPGTSPASPRRPQAAGSIRLRLGPRHPGRAPVRTPPDRGRPAERIRKNSTGRRGNLWHKLARPGRFVHYIELRKLLIEHGDRLTSDIDNWRQRPPPPPPRRIEQIAGPGDN